MTINAFSSKVNFEESDGQTGKIMKTTLEQWKTHSVMCFPLYSMLLAINQTQVDYFSLDVEFQDLNVLKTIPFDEVDIKVITVEYNEDKKEIGPGSVVFVPAGVAHATINTDPSEPLKAVIIKSPPGDEEVRM
jgi:hypothetical protein